LLISQPLTGGIAESHESSGFSSPQSDYLLYNVRFCGYNIFMEDNRGCYILDKFKKKSGCFQEIV
jgi:hypothetical protein